MNAKMRNKNGDLSLFLWDCYDTLGEARKRFGELKAELKRKAESDSIT